MSRYILDTINERPNASAIGGFNTAVRVLGGNSGLGTPNQRLKNSINELSTIINGQKSLPKSKRLSDSVLKTYKNRLSGLKAAANK